MEDGPIASIDLLLLSTLGPDANYLCDIVPGMLTAGFGLGVASVSVAVAILIGARSEETGMLCGLNSTGHEVGGTLARVFLPKLRLNPQAMPIHRVQAHG